MALPATSPPATTSARGRLAVIVMENKEYGAIIGNAQAPYINALAKSSALATNYFAVSHPSLPNYLALAGGDTFGVTTDCTACSVNSRNLVDELDAHGVSWKAYMQGMPSACFNGGSSGRYAKKHNPFMYFDDVRTDPQRCANVVPFAQFDASRMPMFTWITPDSCNDMHDCSVAAGDAFLSGIVPGLLERLGPRGVLFITFDEGSTSRRGGGHVVTIATGDGVRPGRYAQQYNHYSLLRTIADHFGLAPLGQAATAVVMRPLLR
ncbi:MAG: alkaline phosphatase family protein [Actinobacteria bacterium]|nr:alkaline phosphatase family protein [Actinomycetota bacterium]